MADKCKKLTATLVPCDEMALAMSHGLLRHQTLVNRITGKSRERIVLQARKNQYMPIWYCPFCRIDIAIPAAQQTTGETP